MVSEEAEDDSNMQESNEGTTPSNIWRSQQIRCNDANYTFKFKKVKKCKTSQINYNPKNPGYSFGKIDIQSSQKKYNEESDIAKTLNSFDEQINEQSSVSHEDQTISATSRSEKQLGKMRKHLTGTKNDKK